MEQKPKTVLTPNIAGPEYYRPQRFVDVNRFMPWAKGKGFHVVQPPAGDEIEVRKELSDDQKAK